MARTEEQVLAQSPLKVILGGEEHVVKLLVIKDSREWRGQVVELLASLPQFTNLDATDPDNVKKGLNALMGEQVADLFFSYAKALDRDKIESVANDLELSIAFEQVIDIAFPFAGSVVGIAERLSR